MTFTGFIGAVCMFPLRAIISASVALGIHPNTLTLIGVLINVAAAFALGLDHFWLAFVISPTFAASALIVETDPEIASRRCVP